MTNIKREKQRKEKIDPFYGQPIGSRRLEIEQLYFKLRSKYHELYMGIHEKHLSALGTMKEKCNGLGPWDALVSLHKQGYFELLALMENERRKLDESPLGRIVSDEPRELFDISDHKNMLDSSGGLWRIDSDPVIKRVLTDAIYDKKDKDSRRKQRDRARIYGGRRMNKATYEKYLSEAVGRSITIEQYEREFGFLSDNSSFSKKEAKNGAPTPN